jgi:hypothetical protein
MAVPDRNTLGMHRIWASPFTPQIRGELRQKINQFTDPSGTILTPKKGTPSHTFRGSRVIQVDEGDGPGDVCIPVEVASILVDPVMDPYPVGETVTLSAFGISGTEPYTYQWFVNGVQMSTDPTYEHTLVDSDVMNPNESGIGTVHFTLFVTNECGGDSVVGIINVQVPI